ncbi:hypothetical protein SKAU_G00007020 [Synaphobranchus kaupii]|uniref:Uncharacterized protein n=1 Tax=Synaphobranchus kaupii TaxID=118154 RepID=A0A9Q1G983_SYNKA|nr:hypothetical protein SKAU_G00007020 [Synaphobranchus kaupii]
MRAQAAFKSPIKGSSPSRQSMRRADLCHLVNLRLKVGVQRLESECLAAYGGSPLKQRRRRGAASGAERRRSEDCHPRPDACCQIPR